MHYFPAKQEGMISFSHLSYKKFKKVLLSLPSTDPPQPTQSAVTLEAS